MKVNIIPALIAFCISALLSYGLYTLCNTEGKEVFLSIGGGICFCLTLFSALAVRFEQGRKSVNTAVLGWVFFFLLLISNGIFAFIQFGNAAYIIVNGILLLTFVGIFYALAKAEQ